MPNGSPNGVRGRFRVRRKYELIYIFVYIFNDAPPTACHKVGGNSQQGILLLLRRRRLLSRVRHTIETIVGCHHSQSTQPTCDFTLQRRDTNKRQSHRLRQLPTTQTMGKFLRDDAGRMVSIRGSPVLEKTLDRKPRDCQSCGFAKWIKGDKLFIVAGNEWICPDCAVKRGLPVQYYQRNHYATQPLPAGVLDKMASSNPKSRPGQTSLGEIFACMCYF